MPERSPPNVNEPGEQTAHTEAPSLGGLEYFPAAQFSQDVAPVTEAYLPTSQGTQYDIPPTAMVPTGHNEHKEAPSPAK